MTTMATCCRAVCTASTAGIDEVDQLVEVGFVGRENNLGFTIIGHPGIELLPDILGAVLLGHAGQDGTRLF